jgi:hypothetical protein
MPLSRSTLMALDEEGSAVVSKARLSADEMGKES